ncbi:MAG: hydrogenase formation protein HypD [bacterium]
MLNNNIEFKSKFADMKLIDSLINDLYRIAKQNYIIMEVCGTHTVAFLKFGLKSLLPKSIRVIAGPGCPVCVTPQKLIDYSISLADYAIIVSYGDIFRVPGSFSSLEKVKSKGKDIRIVYSITEALDIAIDNPKKMVVFLAVGFETTAPATANVLIRAKKLNVNNFFILPGHKLIPPAIEYLCSNGVNANGFMLPGHVSTIIGCSAYQSIVDKYKIPCVVTGFEAIDIVTSIYKLVEQINNNDAKLDNTYSRGVKWYGNPVAKENIATVFRTADSEWRGIGSIPDSGLELNQNFHEFDAMQKFGIKLSDTIIEDNGCRCGDVLLGIIEPEQCVNFGNKCTPEEPIGPCMVSSEGTCAAYFKYGKT